MKFERFHQRLNTGSTVLCNINSSLFFFLFFSTKNFMKLKLTVNMTMRSSWVDSNNIIIVGNFKLHLCKTCYTICFESDTMYLFGYLDFFCNDDDSSTDDLRLMKWIVLVNVFFFLRLYNKLFLYWVHFIHK